MKQLTKDTIVRGIIFLGLILAAAGGYYAYIVNNQ